MGVLPVTDQAAAALEPYRTLRRPRDHWRRGIFVAEGRLVVERLLRSSLRVLSVLTTDKWLPRVEELLRARAEDPPVFLAPRKLLENLIGFPYHQGLLAVAECPPNPTLAEALARTSPPRTLVALDGLTSAENVGTIVRGGAALGAAGVLVGETTCSPYLRRAVRNSLGGVFALPILHLTSLAETLRQLREDFGFQLVAADSRARVSVTAQRFAPDVCLVLGGEDSGLSEAARRVCQDFVTIPMEHGMDALNVAAASAIFLHEIRRRRPPAAGERTP